MVVDALVVGAGAAGSACATLIAREGLHVQLVDRPGSSHARPAEVFAPQTLRLIQSLGLPLPDVRHGAARCRGVLSLWGSANPEFFDNELYACAPGVIVDRLRYDAQLVAGAIAAGVMVLPPAALLYHQVRFGRGVWQGPLPTYPDTMLHASVVIDATGRNSGFVPPRVQRRQFLDRLVALFTPYPDLVRDPDLLLVEAAADGWWYAARDSAGPTSVVYVSDADLLPRTAAARTQYLYAAFAATDLPRAQFSSVPEFDQHRAVDARVSRRTAVCGEHWVAIGDAAFAIDPLSGEGTHFAFLSAEKAAGAIAAFLRNGTREPLDEFSAWFEAQFAEQCERRCHTYFCVERALHDQLFWSRRLPPTGQESGEAIETTNLVRRKPLSRVPTQYQRV